MLIIRLSGGIGNQLFQYAFGRNLSLKIGLPLRFDTRSFDLENLRALQINKFSIEFEAAHYSDLACFGLVPSKWFSLQRLFKNSGIIFKESEFELHSHILKKGQPVYYDGYWQSEKYFKENEAIIRSELKLRQPIAECRRALEQDILSSNAVSLHVRRGDYVERPEIQAIHGNCERDWYDKALTLLKDQVENLKIFIFTDDIEWVRSNMTFDVETVYVPKHDDGNDHEDLILMSKCDHHIIANSSFSWWGAWLNSSTSKLVIAPDRWFKSADKSTLDLIPESWIRLV